MNRLMIIGNGFDIAHGLKTKYSDFINYYWEKIVDSNYADKFISFSVGGVFDLKSCKSLKEILLYIGAGLNTELKKKNNSSDFYHHNNPVVRIGNDFFCRINERYDEANWVDIEMEYFASIKRILNRPKSIDQADDVYDAESLKRILKLNDEISKIADAFEQYLVSEVVPEIRPSYNQ